MEQEFFSTSEARKHLSDLINQVKYQGKSFSFGRRGKAEAMLVPVRPQIKPEAQPQAKFQTRPKPLHEIVAERKTEQNASIDYGSRLFVHLFESLARKYDLGLVILFGSHGRKKTKPDSDIDLAVKGGTKPLSRQMEQELFNELVPLFERDDIDLVNLDFTHDVVLRYNIFSEGKILFEKEEGLFRRLLVHAYFEYHDFERYFKRNEELLTKKINRLIEAAK
ncbi:MAG: nucleotidyltransferase domain-containing protein [Patescibacteria group bacterium]